VDGDKGHGVDEVVVDGVDSVVGLSVGDELLAYDALDELSRHAIREVGRVGARAAGTDEDGIDPHEQVATRQREAGAARHVDEALEDDSVSLHPHFVDEGPTAGGQLEVGADGLAHSLDVGVLVLSVLQVVPDDSTTVLEVAHRARHVQRSFAGMRGTVADGN